VRPSTAKNAVLCHAGVKDSGCEPNSGKSQQKKENKTMPKPNPNELEQTFALLGSSEQMVLRLRSGLVDGHRHSLREVGTFLGTSRAVVRSLEWQGWQKLQAHAQSNQSASESVYYILDRCRTRKPKIN
jgi:DNA-directed RNA polymerase sigma subunit (sigma70/sigma32)